MVYEGSDADFCEVEQAARVMMTVRAAIAFMEFILDDMGDYSFSNAHDWMPIDYWYWLVFLRRKN